MRRVELAGEEINKNWDGLSGEVGVGRRAPHETIGGGGGGGCGCGALDPGAATQNNRRPAGAATGAARSESVGAGRVRSRAAGRRKSVGGGWPKGPAGQIPPPLPPAAVRALETARRQARCPSAGALVTVAPLAARGHCCR